MLVQIFQDQAGEDEGLVHEWELVDDAPIEEIRNAITSYLEEHGAIKDQWSPAREGNPALKELPETHQRGIISIHNIRQTVGDTGDEKCIDGDFGIQISSDGRVWVCIDGIAFVRFKPERRK